MTKDEILAAVDAEPELEGHPPHAVLERLAADPVETLRDVVRATKQGIRDRLEAALAASPVVNPVGIASVEEEDTDAVVMARIGLLDYHLKRGLLFPGMDERNRELNGLIDTLILAVQQASHAEIERLNRRMSELSDANVRLSTLYDAEVANRVERAEQAEQAGDVG